MFPTLQFLNYGTVPVPTSVYWNLPGRLH